MQWLLVTDLDNTLVGNDIALAELNAQLTQLRAQNQALLVYSTGRSLTSYRELCTTTDLLTPDVLVTAVGTEIYTAPTDEPDPKWVAQLEPGWDRPLIEQIASTFPDLIPQPDPEQRPFKASYFLNGAIASQVMAELSESLRSEGISAQLIYSGSKDLDILPQAANKGKALKFVQTQLGIADESTIACGDSGNDIALFGQHWGVIVGNAQSELLSWHYENPAPQRYLATAHYAAGIHEGLRHFGML